MTDPEPNPHAYHPAPPGWKPLSGLALASFLLSLVCLGIGVFGPWIVCVLPLGLAILALLKFNPEKQRGRAMAIWALAISLGGGSIAYSIHQSGRVLFFGIGESFLTALSAEGEQQTRTDALRLWTWSDALEKDAELINTWQARYDETVAEMGPWTGEMATPSIFSSLMTILSQPEGLLETGSGEKPPNWAMGSVFWIPARFEKGVVCLALVVQDGDAAAVSSIGENLKGKEPVPMFGDLRFYRVPKDE